MKSIDILNKWAEFSDYDPDRTRFRLGDYSIDVHQGNKLISALNNTYDSTGGLSVIYAKILCQLILNGTSSSFYNVLTNDDVKKRFEDSRKMWEIFTSQDVEDIENLYYQNINHLIFNVLKNKVIGDSEETVNKETLFSAIKTAVEGLEKCKESLHVRGGEIVPITKFSTSIHVFSSLADCLTKLESVAEGIYLCYIDIHESLDGYFSFFIKNNGNILSVNERIDEAYAGQHKNSRNGRYSDAKQYELFPYNFIFEYCEHDYKGYATKHIIDEEQLAFFKLQEDAYLPIIVAMMLLKSKYEGKALTLPLEYVDSLLPVNINKQSIAGEETALTIVANSAVIASHAELDIQFEVDKVLSGEYDKEYDLSNKNRTYVDGGIFVGQNKLFIEMYGGGFTFDPKTILLANNPLELSDDNSDKTDNKPSNEFVGTKERLELQAYYNVRGQLAKHIRAEIAKELQFFGDNGYIKNWYQNETQARLDLYINVIAQKYLDVEAGNAKFSSPNGFYTNDDSFDICMTESDYPKGSYPAVILNSEVRPYSGKYLCNINQKPCNVFFVITPKDWRAFDILLGEYPKILKGWKAHRVVSGNHLLYAVDPVAHVETPFEKSYENPNYCNFKIAVGFSKSGLNKLIKDYVSIHNK